ncbi:MAG: hypothetical protein WC799_11000 [Desulfobacteraceae bacterium]
MEKALTSDNDESVKQLVVLHDTVMETLVQGNEELRFEMKDVIIDAEQKIKKLILTIQTMQMDIKSQLSIMNNKRLIQSTYHSKDAR